MQTTQRDGVAAAQACKAPVRSIQAASPRPRSVRFHELRPQVMLGRTIGDGHVNMLEAPEQVNAISEQFLALLCPTPHAPHSMTLAPRLKPEI